MPRAAGLLLFVALCALATHWVLTFSAMRTIPVPKAARIAQTEPVETGAVATLFGGSAQAGVRDVQLIGVVADLDGVGPAAAILSLDGGPPKAVRVGASLSPQIRLTEIHSRNIVIERNGIRQEILLPVQGVLPAGRPGNAPAAPPAGAGAPLSTPMPSQPIPSSTVGAPVQPQVPGQENVPVPGQTLPQPLHSAPQGVIGENLGAKD
jgi:general secretion pathway protein C